ncbi:hypothetical protein DFJ73DRAFT_20226 [Zopfochytrium polystomum]|nr:hypothetical protein DFJ73DRAFT_20226 [Zopfochytrium polystomum]
MDADDDRRSSNSLLDNETEEPMSVDEDNGDRRGDRGQHLPLQSVSSDSAVSESTLPALPSHLHLLEFINGNFPTTAEGRREALKSFEQARFDFVKDVVIPAVAGNSPNATRLERVLSGSLANIILGEMEKPGSTVASVRDVIKRNTDVDLSSPHDVFQDYDKIELEEAFSRTFADPDEYLEILRRQLLQYAEEYSDRFYFPGVSIVQTSGSGKSRAIAELSKSFYVVYCSFMRKDSSGYPQRSYIADELYKGNSDFATYFKACYEMIGRYERQNSLSELSQEQIRRRFFQQQIREGTTFYQDLEQTMLEIRVAGTGSGLSNPSSLKALFVFDEARQLRSEYTIPGPSGIGETAFVRMRRAAASLISKQRPPAFIIMMDTTSRVATLSPAAENDPSMRVVKGHQIFPPLFLIGSIDVGQASAYGQSMDDALDEGRLFCLGRPLWQSMLKEKTSKFKRRVRTLAIVKLAGGSPNPEFDETFAIAVIRTRVPFVVLRSHVATDLVASHMWWCLGIDDTRQHVVAGLPSEPVLAEAGACWTHIASYRDSIFQYFRKAVTAGFIDVGEGGETVAQLVLILGRDSAAASLGRSVSPISGEPPVVQSPPMSVKVSAENLTTETEQNPSQTEARRQLLDRAYTAADSCLFSGAVSVLAFLEATLPTVAVQQLRGASALLASQTGLPDPVTEGKVSFTHFVPMFERVTSMRDLATLFSRGAAVKCSPGCPGVDLIIPVLMPDVTGNFRILEGNMSFLLVQVKNYHLRGQDRSFPDSATVDNSPQRCGLDPFPQHLYLSVYMGLDFDPAVCQVLAPVAGLDKDDRVGFGEYALLLHQGRWTAELQNLRQKARDLWRQHQKQKKRVRLEKSTRLTIERADSVGSAARGGEESGTDPADSLVVNLVEALRKRRQVAISLRGFNERLYPCLAGKPAVLQCLGDILRGPSNPLSSATEKSKAVLARMTYPSSVAKMRSVEAYTGDDSRAYLEMDTA